MEDNQQAIEAAADWWSKQLQLTDKREEFKTALVPILTDEWSRISVHREHLPKWQPVMFVDVDYDPCKHLLGALRACGIECAGFLFSAEGLFYSKTRSAIGEGYFAVSEGYGAPWKDILGVSGRAS